MESTERILVFLFELRHRAKPSNFNSDFLFLYIYIKYISGYCG